MIIHYGSTNATVSITLANDLDSGIGIVPPKVKTHASMLRVAKDLSDRIRLVDFQWYRPPAHETEWIQEEYGRRSDLIRSTALREAFFRQVADDIPGGPLIAIAGDVDDGRRSTEYARELAVIRDAHFSGRELISSIVISRQGLTDPATIASLLATPKGVDGVSIAVDDVDTYPSDWTVDEWGGWLTLIRRIAASGYRVILPYSDVRGLVGLGAGAVEIGSGGQKDFRQLRPAQARSQRSNGGGVMPAVSYMSVPLLSVLHGTNTKTDPRWRELESHRDSSAILGPLPRLHIQGASFDPEWLADGQGKGETISNRIRQHLTALADVEAAILASLDPVDTVEKLLEEAVTTASGASSDLFKNPRSSNELETRLKAYRQVRSDLAF